MILKGTVKYSKKIDRNGIMKGRYFNFGGNAKK